MMMAWTCLIMALHKLDSVSLNTFRVGHSHNPIGQRLGTVAAAWSRAEVLQDPGQFRERVRTHVAPIHNRVLHPEHMNTIFDWTT